MATRGRVQVNDLAAPEAIRPYGFQSDTFAAPARPAINNDWENLERGLAAFGSGVNQLHARMKADGEKQYAEDMKAYEERAKAEYAKFRLSRTSDEMVQAWREGAVPFQHDPIMYLWLNKAWAQDEAEAFGRELDADEHLRENIGKENFDVQGYILEKSQPYSERLYGEEGVLLDFANGVSRHTERLIELDNKFRGENRVALAESRAMQQLDRAFEQAIDDELPPTQQFSDHYRAIYKSLGPRVKGGAPDIRLGRLDELTLEMLADKAADADKAQHVLALLEADRISTDDNATRIGSLESVEAHREKVAAIRKVAEKALADREKDELQKSAIAFAADAFGRQDGSFAGIGDERVNTQLNGVVDVRAEEVKKEAAILWRDQLRAENGGPDVARETDYFAANGVVHEEFFNQLKNGYFGLGNVMLKPGTSPDANSVEQIKRSAALYMQMNKQAPNYMTQLPENVRDFYEMVAVGMGPMGLTADQAAMTAMRISANGDTSFGGSVPQDLRDKIERDLGRVKASLIPAFLGGGIDNPGDLMASTLRMTRLYMQMGNSAEEARTLAMERVNEQTVIVNGKALVGIPGIEKDKEAALDASVKGMWKQHGAAIRAATGAEGAEDLYFIPVGRGYLQLVGPGGKPAQTADGMEIRTTPHQILRVQQNMRSAEEQKRHEAITAARRKVNRSAPRMNSPLSQSIQDAAGAVGSGLKNAGRAIGNTVGDNVIDPFRRVYGNKD